MTKAISAGKIFTGEKWLKDKAILIKDEEIVDKNSIPANLAVRSYDNGFVAPAFIDLQIYGAKGFLLSVRPDVYTLQQFYEYCLEGGVKYFQPTIATNTYSVIYSCIDAVRDYKRLGGTGLVGLHIEGPWINKIRKGAHIESLIH
jgi:N-acetylglucosamine-6-phosphate deacetylase